MEQDISKPGATPHDLKSTRHSGFRDVWKLVPRRRRLARRTWIYADLSDHLKDDIGLRF